MLILTAARLAAEKGIAYLIDCVPAVRKLCPDVYFVVAGEGPDRAELEKRSSTNESASVTFTGFRADVLNLIAACDIFVLPSLAEPFGLVLLEAMALSKPVVATRCGGPTEIVVDGVTGILVPPGDSVALGVAIAKLAGDRDLRERMGRAGYLRFKERFTAARMAAETAAVYRQVLDGRKPSA